ncbi:uncharacterized protein LOC100209742 [Hydra vulgaris]|uniref:uncharacterized protein LOC100209742 n=1 Tax=Hydra vulgaris TaxID=6087 RepID=UPI0002B48219|nr:uncharacterized protein LOC100209742 [Hydra vulgaris]
MEDTVNKFFHGYSDAIYEFAEGESIISPSPDQDQFFIQNHQTFIFPENNLIFPNIRNINVPEFDLESQQSMFLEMFLNNSDFYNFPPADKKDHSECIPTVNIINPETPSSTKFDEEEDDTESILMDTENILNQPELEDFYDEKSSSISDKDLMAMPVRQLNLKLKNLPKDEKLKLKARRRLLKNRGYAQTCRERRLYSQRTVMEENEHLKNLLKQVTIEKNIIESKYNHLKNAIKKAKLSRHHKPC